MDMSDQLNRPIQRPLRSQGEAIQRCRRVRLPSPRSSQRPSWNFERRSKRPTRWVGHGKREWDNVWRNAARFELPRSQPGTRPYGARKPECPLPAVTKRDILRLQERSSRFFSDSCRHYAILSIYLAPFQGSNKISRCIAGASSGISFSGENFAGNPDDRTRRCYCQKCPEVLAQRYINRGGHICVACRFAWNEGFRFS